MCIKDNTRMQIYKTPQLINAPETVSHHTKPLRNNPVMNNAVDIREAVVTNS